MARARHQRGQTDQSQPPDTQQRRGSVETTSSLGQPLEVTRDTDQ